MAMFSLDTDRFDASLDHLVGDAVRRHERHCRFG
jgi:hypothetical protein